MSDVVNLCEIRKLQKIVDEIRAVRQRYNDISRSLKSDANNNVIKILKMIEDKKKRTRISKEMLQLMSKEDELRFKFYDLIYSYNDISDIEFVLIEYGKMLAETSPNGTLKETIEKVSSKEYMDKYIKTLKLYGMYDPIFDKNPRPIIVSKVGTEILEIAKSTLSEAYEALKSGNYHEYIIKLAKYQAHKNDLMSDYQLKDYYLENLQTYELDLKNIYGNNRQLRKLLY